MSLNISKAVLEALLPPGSIWIPKFEADLDLLFNGIAENTELIRIFLANLAFLRDPLRTTALEDLEKEYGLITNIRLTEDERRQALLSTKTAVSGFGADFMQAKLREAGFDVFVTVNNLPVDPDPFIGQDWTAVCGNQTSVCGHEDAVMGSVRAELIVNQIFFEQNGQGSPIEYAIPGASGFWGLFFFVGGVATQLIFGPTLLLNGDMESGNPPFYWDIDTALSIASVADERPGGSGTQSIEVERGADFRCVRQRITLENGALYELSGWTKNIDATDCRFEVVNISGGQIAQTPPASFTGWQLSKVQFISDVEEADVYLRIDGISGEFARFDDVIIRKMIEAKGPNTVLNGDMEEGDPPNDWNNFTSSVLSRVNDERTGGEGLYSINVERGTTNIGAVQVIITEIGETYQIKSWLRNVDAVSVAVDIVGTSPIPGTIVTSTEWTEYIFTFVATLTSTTIYLVVDGLQGENGRFDDVSVIKVSDEGEGITDIQPAEINVARRAELITLILKYKPTHAWCGLVADYVETEE